MGGGPPGPRDHGKPPPTWPQEACWASRSGPLPSRAPSGCVGPRDIGGSGGGKKKRGQRRGALQDGGSRENTPSFSPAHLGPVSLLWSWTWSSALQGQRYSWAPPAALSLSPTPQPPRAFSDPEGPKHRPHPPPKPSPCLSPALYNQGLFCLFSSPFFYYCGSVLPSGGCFIYIFIFLF